MNLIFKNIKELVQVRNEPLKWVSGNEMSVLPTIKNAFLWVEKGLIKDFGPMEACPIFENSESINATGKILMPTWCDSHTHLVFAGNRELEFVDKINGLSYEEIAKRGGGILNSAKKLNETSFDELYEQSKQRLTDIIAMGTGAVEIKSGYGLSFEGELKMLRVIKKLKEQSPIAIKATFLGAHALPEAYRNDRTGYIKMLINELLPAIATENLADYVDVFCETNYFSVDEMDEILKASKKFNLAPKVHVNQFTSIGGIQAAVKQNARSVDHLEVMTAEDIQALKNTQTMPVALPGCSFYLGIPFAPAKAIIEAGLPLALASDFNPGSSPSGNMSFVVAMACIKMKLTPEQAINAATLNGAYTMGLESELGSITKGKRANLILTKPINSYVSIPYMYSTNQIEQVYINGEAIKNN
jgi:imidazolonepropionase